MAKYDKNFKLICIKAYEEGKPLPQVDGVLDRSLNRYVKLWRLVYREMGERGLEDGFLQHNFTVKEKIRAVKLVLKGLSFSDAARKMGMRTHLSVRRWYLAYMKDGVAGLQYRKGTQPSTSVETSTPMKKRLSKSEREELLALRKRNEMYHFR